VKSIEAVCGEKCWLAGQTLVYLEYSNRISRSLIDSLSASLLTVVLLLLLLAYIQGNSNYFSLILSSIWGPLVMLGCFSLLQIPVTAVTSIFFALIVGWTGDNAIQYMFASDDLIEGANERASASLMQTVLFCGSSLLFVFHTFIPMKILGVAFILGFLMTYIGDLWILKSLLQWKVKAPLGKSTGGIEH
jgi:predicted RND superfamily exporter protein